MSRNTLIITVVCFLGVAIAVSSAHASKNSHWINCFGGHKPACWQDNNDEPDGMADPDQDGFSTQEEQELGTDPFDSQSRPTLADNAGKILAYWPLNTNATEMFGSGLDGMLKNGALFSDSAVWLDGRNDYVSFGNDKTLSVTGSISVCAWIKPEKRRVKMRLWGKYQIKDKERAHCAFLSADRLWLFLSGDGSPCFGQTILKFTIQRITEKHQWRHVAMTWDSEQGADGLSSYADGQKQAMLTLTDADITSLHDSTADLTLGAYDIKEIRQRRRTFEVVNNSFCGSMSQMVLCDAPLTDLEVKELYLLGREGDLPAYLERDSDGDGMPDWWERASFGDVSETADGDYDGDGLSNIDEYTLNTEPGISDTDEDGLTDGQEVHVYGTDPTNPDTDGDGWKDGLEVQNGTDPNNFLSFPAEIAGTIIYAGRQPGPIIVMAVTGADDWTSEYLTEIPDPGPYVITNIPTLKEYSIKAYGNSNQNNTNDYWEANGSYDDNPLYLTNDTGSIDIGLNDSDVDADGLPDWWEIYYFGNLRPKARADFDSDDLNNINEYLAQTDPTDSDTDDDGLLDGEEIYTYGTDPNNADSDGDGWSDGDEVKAGSDPNNDSSFPVNISGAITYDGKQVGPILVVASAVPTAWSYEYSTVIAAPGNYVITNVPNLTNYWIRAFRDLNRDGVNEPLDAEGDYISNPLYLTDDLSNVDITLSDLDEDEDSLPDWWEVVYLGVLSDGSSDDTDLDGIVNMDEYLVGSDPDSVDTDHDGVEDLLDGNSVSRGFIAWGDANHSLGDDYICALPAWVVRCYKDGGEWFSWHEYSSTPDNEGELYIEIDRTQLDQMGKDLVMEIKFFDYDNASFYVELLTAGHEFVAPVLPGNPMQGTLTDVRLEVDVPMMEYESATVIHIRRGTGNITIYETVLRIDQDHDGVDFADEVIYGSSDENAHSDTDGLPDGWEVLNGLDPTVEDSDLDGIEDGDDDDDGDLLNNLEEYNLGTSSDNPDTDGDYMPDGWEVAHSLDPTDKSDMISDTDGDRIPAIYEYKKETDPVSALSVPTPDIYVTDPYGIQAALDASQNDYDIIQVADGTYANEYAGLDFKGKVLLLMSENGPENCIVDCKLISRPDNDGRGFRFTGGEDRRTCLLGFTIRRGEVLGVLGAGISCHGSPTIRDCVMTECTGGRGAVFIGFDASPAIENCRILNNTSLLGPNYASGIHFAGLGENDTIVRDCVIEGNIGGPALMLRPDSRIPRAGTLLIERCVIRGNTSGSGGGIHLLAEDSQYECEEVIIRDCMITDNTGSSGGGISHDGVRRVSIENCVIAGNTAVTGGGLSFYESGYGTGIRERVIVKNCTIVNNNAQVGGGIFHEEDQQILIRNSIVWGNLASGVSSQIEVSDDPDAELTVEYSCIEDGWSGAGNIMDDPQLVPVTFRLETTSPCIDAGNPVCGTSHDMDGEARRDHPDHANVIVNGEESIVDIGADEFVDTDGDKLPDVWEQMYYSLELEMLAYNMKDTDQDGIDDLYEDEDSDGLNNLEEYHNGTNPDNADTDEDGMGDGAEVAQSRDPIAFDNYQQVPFFEGFENDATPVLQGELDGQQGWQAMPLGKAFVQGENAHYGAQVLAMQPSTYPSSIKNRIGANSFSVIWVDVWMQIDPTSITRIEDHPNISEMEDYLSCVFSLNRAGHIFVYNGLTLNWEQVILTDPITGGNYRRYTARQDYGMHRWSLYVDGVLVRSDIGMRGPAMEVSLFLLNGTEEGVTYVDDIGIGTTTPSGIVP